MLNAQQAIATVFRRFKSRPSQPKNLRRTTKRPLRMESLENRDLFALLTGATLVNTTTANSQYDVAVAAASSGNSVAVWTHEYSSSDTDIYAQRFDSQGRKVGAEIRVASSVRREFQPDVAMDPTGDFVVTWVDQVSSNNTDIKAQRFTSAGARRGGTITVASAAKNERTPSIAAAANGDFVVTWALEYSSSDVDVKARMFRDSGTAVSGPFTVAASTVNESYPDVARAPDGRFAISYGNDNGNGNVVVKRYSSTGSLVNTHSVAQGTARQLNPRISMDNNANTAVVWQEYVGSDYDIFARRISNTGVVGSRLTVRATTNQEVLPDVSYKRDGSAFAVTYYDMTAFSNRVTEMSNTGRLSDSTIDTRPRLETTAIAFDAGGYYRVAYERVPSGSTSDIYQRRGRRV